MVKMPDELRIKVRVGGDLDWISMINVVDADDKTAVRAKLGNPGWHLLHIGTGTRGQTTLTWGWGDKPEEDNDDH